MSKKNFLPNATFRVYPLDKSLNKKWFVRYKLPNGKRREAVVYSFPTVEEREAAAQIIIEKLKLVPLDNNYQQVFQAANFKTEKLLDTLDSRVGQLSKKTLESYKSKVKILDSFCKENNHRFLTEDVANKFIDNLREKKLSEITILNYQLTYSTLFKYLIKKKEIRKNPFNEIEFARGHSEPRGYFRTGQMEQIKKSINANAPEIMPACEFFYYLLCRPKELRLIKIQDINFDNWTIKIRWDVGKNTSVNKVNRFVVIPNALKEIMIERKIADYPQNYYLVGKTGLPSLEVVPRDYWSKKMTAILRSMGYSSEYTLYSLKNTGAISFYKAGIGLVEIQRQIGHKDINTTIIYLRSMGFDDFENVRKNVPAF